ncbi:MAG: hypothetical protein JW873_06390 [Candidatus Saganbacteria bacterium]|nr:hypothetical protein [Candidatus Saganbacteria bacterium]
MSALPVERIGRMSVYNPARVGRRAGIPAHAIDHAIGGDRLLLDVVHWGAETFKADPHHVGLLLSHGNDAHVHVSETDTTPKMFYESLAVGRTSIAREKVLKIFGNSTVWESYFTDPKAKDLFFKPGVASLIENDQAIPDDKKQAFQAVLSETHRGDPGWVMGRFKGKPGKPEGPITWTPLDDNQVPSKLDGRLARWSSRLGSERGMENIVGVRDEGLDLVVTHISEGADRRFVVVNADNLRGKKKKGTDELTERARLIERLDRLMIEESEQQKLTVTDDGRVILTLYSVVHDDQNRPVEHEVDVTCLHLDVDKMYRNPADGKFTVKLIVPDERIDFECLKREHVITITNEVEEPTDTALLKASRDRNGFTLVIEPKGNNGQRAVIPARSIHRLKKDPAFKALSRSDKRAAITALIKTFDVDNMEMERVKDMRQRYVLQYHHYREERLENVLDKPLEKDAEGNALESVVVTKAVSSLEVVHLDDWNGRAPGDREVVPLPFQIPPHCRLDPRPHAMHTSRFIDPTGTALAPQHLIDPYVMGTEVMAAVWPKVDQLGFFGVFMLAAMSFPHGNVFTDPARNPWFVRSFGTVSHSIFDAKGDAGKRYYWLTGNPTLDSMLISRGAAMVTGPNTDAANPVREGHLFLQRIPGRAPHQYKTAMPGFYISVVEDAQVSYMDMTMFGLKTETTILPLSAGGGLDHYQTAWTVQRSQRWNGGKCIFTWDGAQEMWIDLTRGSFNINRTESGRLYNASRTSLLTSPRLDGLSRTQPADAAQEARVSETFDHTRPVTPKYTMNEAREWINVGTWYWVSFQKLALNLSVPAMIILTVLPIPVAGSMFLVACLAATCFAWPFWAIQMMKVGVNPKKILSLNPIHLFWGDMPMRTMFKSGLDIERMGVGKFRVSDRTKGNRLPTKDKRVAFWVGAVLPTVAGALLTGSAAAVTLGVGALPIVTTALPFLAGYLVSSVLSRLVRRFVPNANSHSFLLSLVRWGASALPLTVGIVASAMTFGTMSVFAIPLVTAIMAGGWSLFNGINITRAFRRYFKEQREAYSKSAPNPVCGTIPKHLADTGRNAVREAFGKVSPLYEADEFVIPEINPAHLTNEIASNFPQWTSLLNSNDGPIANLNKLVGAYEPVKDSKEFFMTDLAREMSGARPTLRQACQAETNLLDPLSRRAKIWWLSRKTQAVRDSLRENIAGTGAPDNFKIRITRRGNEQYDRLEPEMYDRICELNRLVIEECAGSLSPRKDI